MKNYNKLIGKMPHLICIFLAWSLVTKIKGLVILFQKLSKRNNEMSTKKHMKKQSEKVWKSEVFYH